MLTVTDLNLPFDKLTQFSAALGDAVDATGTYVVLQNICDSADADVQRLTTGYVIDPDTQTNWGRTLALYRAYSQAQFGEIPKAVSDDYKTAWDELTAIAEGRRPNLPKIANTALAGRAGAIGSRRQLRGRMGNPYGDTGGGDI